MTALQNAELEPANPVSTNRNPYSHFHDEIMARVLKPKLLQVIADCNIVTLSDFYEYFRSTFDCNVSNSTLRQWLADADIKIETRGVAFTDMAVADA